MTPISRTPFLQADLRLTPASAKRLSPALFPAPAACGLTLAVGETESEEFHRQMRLIQDAWGRSVVPVCEALPGLNHFSVLEALVQPGHRLHQIALELLRG